MSILLENGLTTVNGEQFLISEVGDDDKVVAFATADNLKRLAEAETLLVDGTFDGSSTRSSPSIPYRVEGMYAYCLLPNKKQETYERVFQLLEEKIQVDSGLEFLPTTVLSNSELAIMNAAIKGCVSICHSQGMLLSFLFFLICDHTPKILTEHMSITTLCSHQ